MPPLPARHRRSPARSLLLPVSVTAACQRATVAACIRVQSGHLALGAEQTFTPMSPLGSRIVPHKWIFFQLPCRSCVALVRDSISESREGEGEARRAYSEFYTSQEQEAICIARRSEQWLVRAKKPHFFPFLLALFFFFGCRSEHPILKMQSAAP